MLNKQVMVQNKLGLHTRAAAKLVTLAAKFESKIQLQHNERIADCKSIMAIILLGATKGITMNLIITGADENNAAEAISSLFDNRFDEPE